MTATTISPEVAPDRQAIPARRRFVAGLGERILHLPTSTWGALYHGAVIVQLHPTEEVAFLDAATEVAALIAPCAR